MKITLEATGIIENLSGRAFPVQGVPSGTYVPARVWKGRTESGIEITAWIPIIQVPIADTSEFERELSEVKAERRLTSFDMRML